MFVKSGKNNFENQLLGNKGDVGKLSAYPKTRNPLNPNFSVHTFH